jgi:hypothetical protein
MLVAQDLEIHLAQVQGEIDGIGNTHHDPLCCQFPCIRVLSGL